MFLAKVSDNRSTASSPSIGVFNNGCIQNMIFGEDENGRPIIELVLNVKIHGRQESCVLIDTSIGGLNLCHLIVAQYAYNVGYDRDKITSYDMASVLDVCKAAVTHMYGVDVTDNKLRLLFGKTPKEFFQHMLG